MSNMDMYGSHDQFGQLRGETLKVREVIAVFKYRQTRPPTRRHALLLRLDPQQRFAHVPEWGLAVAEP